MTGKVSSKMYTKASSASLQSPDARSSGRSRQQARAATARHKGGTALPSNSSRWAIELVLGLGPAPSTSSPGQASRLRCCNTVRRTKSTSKQSALAARATLFASRSTRRTLRNAAQHWQMKSTSKAGSGRPCVSSSKPKTTFCTCCNRADEMCSIVRCVGDWLDPKKAWAESSVKPAWRHTSFSADSMERISRFLLGFLSTRRLTSAGFLA
mmetsp:Transcript_48000/g.138996  ORF Transcript_48000/g.138996 Transcript_48000/m.138996 type:complete len:211 (-) Transcript_48000:2636-3268(-)